ncbi:NUDIX domain-containing protein [Ectothiorhodospiraceae bacterium WFHF3C12]|nr:NUDIX domain-containing protein [Ectothiorhodospiraceae bacterium WFHF3C12]
MARELNYCPRCSAVLTTVQLGGQQRTACPDPVCGYVFWNNPVPVVAAIVETPAGVVLARNKGWPEKMFGLVTGFLEAGESPDQGVLREVEEELALTGRIASFLGNYSFYQANQLLICYHVTAAGEPQPGEELAEIRVIPVERLRPWEFGTGPALRDWLAGRGMGP